MAPTRPRHASGTAPAASGPGRPKDLGKRAAILDSAKKLFTTQGYEGVSMDAIAADAGVSKLTVYSHFGDKDALFAAAVKSHCEQGVPPSLLEDVPAMPLRDRLMQIAGAFYAMITAPEAIAGHRMLCTPQLANTPLAQMFWDAGPRRVHEGFEVLLRARIAAGDLDIPDVPTAASQFFTLLKGEAHARLVMGCGCPGASADPQRHVAASVDMFLRAYGTRAAGR